MVALGMIGSILSIFLPKVFDFGPVLDPLFGIWQKTDPTPLGGSNFFCFQNPLDADFDIRQISLW